MNNDAPQLLLTKIMQLLFCRIQEGLRFYQLLQKYYIKRNRNNLDRMAWKNVVPDYIKHHLYISNKKI